MDLDDFAKAAFDFNERLSFSLYSLANSIVKTMSPIEELITAFAEKIASLYPSSGEQRRIIDSLQKWGEFGWCLIDWVEIEFYHNIPKSIEEADNLVLEYCSDKIIYGFIEELRDKVDNIIEFDEAIFCYENEKYTSCSLILFSIIDSMFIRMQEKKKNDNRKLALGFSKELRTSHDHVNFMIETSCLATLNAIKTFFRNGQDFTNEQQDIANRNFVSHGMNKRAVTKIDCIKLFLIIKGVFDIKEEYGLEYKSE